MKLLFVWIFAVIFLIDSILRVLRTTFNMGAFMMYLITGMLWCYALFHRQIDAFCTTGFGKILKILFFSGCFLFVLLLIFIAVSGYSSPADYTENAVIVLGAGVRGEKVTGLLARRLDAAYEYHLLNPKAVIIVTGGQGRGESIPEAQAMKSYLMEKGVPAEMILEEKSSTSTEENFLYAKNILIENGISAEAPAAYVTNAFHCYRSAKYAQAAGFSDVRSVPASIGVTSILPCYMREVLAVLYYWVFRA